MVATLKNLGSMFLITFPIMLPFPAELQPSNRTSTGILCSLIFICSSYILPLALSSRWAISSFSGISGGFQLFNIHSHLISFYNFHVFIMFFSVYHDSRLLSTKIPFNFRHLRTVTFQKRRGKDSRQQRGACKIHPDPCKSKGPEHSYQKDREQKSRGKRNERRFFCPLHSDHVTLGGKRKPPGQVCQGKQSHRQMRHFHK